VSDLGNIHDRSVRAFAVKPRAFGAPLSGFGALTAQHGRTNCCPCRDAIALFCGQCLTGVVLVFSTNFVPIPAALI
jgi:hypothetical protein